MTSINTTPIDAAPPNLTELVAGVEEDPALSSVEKEITLLGSKVDDRVTIFTEIGSLTRRLLRHSQFEIDWVRVPPSVEPTQRLSPKAYSRGRITGIKGTLPVGALKIQSKSRSDSAYCKVVSKDGLWDL